jgi:hypothetical protein
MVLVVLAVLIGATTAGDAACWDGWQRFHLSSHLPCWRLVMVGI